MSTRWILAVILLAGCVVLGGCNGPTKAGKEARAAARKRLDETNAQLAYDQAKRAFEVGQFDKSLREIRQSLLLDMERPEYHLLLGRIYLETSRLEPAAQVLTRATELREGYAEAHYFLGIVYQRWSKDQDAYHQYMQAYEADSTNVHFLMAASETMVSLGQYEMAKTLIKSKISYFEHNAALRHLLGQIELLQGNPFEAAKLYAEARLLAPDDGSLLEELARAQYAARQYGKCFESVKQLQRLEEKERRDLLLLEARCLAHMNRGSVARGIYMKLSRLEPADVVIWTEFGALAWDLGDFRRVDSCGERVVSLAPERYEGYILKGIAQRHRGDLDEAIDFFRMAADRAPEAALPHLMLGKTLEESGQRRNALAAYAGAMRVQPDNPEVQSLLSRLSADEGRALAAVPE